MARNSNASYESSDNRRIPLSGVDTSLSGRFFATLEDFVMATDGIVLQRDRGCSFHFYDTGGWCPKGTVNQWYRCMMVRYQNPVGTQYSVGGTVILSSDSYSLYYGFIAGTTTFTVEWTTIKDDGVIRAALPRIAGTLNGHFFAAPTGRAGITAHENGDITNMHRIQLNSDGSLGHYSSTDSGATWTSHGSYVRTDLIKNTSTKTITLTSGYFNTDSFVGCRYNPYIQFATLNIHLYIVTKPANGTVIATGLPKAFSNMYVAIVQTGTGIGTVRLYVNPSGNLIVAGTIASTGWHSGSIMYPYSSL